MAKTCVMHKLSCYSLLENTSLFWNFVEVKSLIYQNDWRSKTFQTLDSNSSKISLITLKGNLSYVLKKCMFMFIKYLIVTKAKWKTVKNLETTWSAGVNYPNRNSPKWEMSRGYLSRGSIIVGGNCPGAIIWRQFPRWELFRGQLS